MGRKKQSVVFTRNANMTFIGCRQPLFPSHGRGNKKRLIFISIKRPYSLVLRCNALAEAVSNRLLQKSNFLSPDFKTEGEGG